MEKVESYKKISELENIETFNETYTIGITKKDDKWVSGKVPLGGFSGINEKLDGKVDKEPGKGLSSNDFTKPEKDKLSGLENYDDAAVKDLISDNSKNIEKKVDKEEGKGLSSNDFTTEEKEKLGTLDNYDDTVVKSMINALPIQSGEGELSAVQAPKDVISCKAEGRAAFAAGSKCLAKGETSFTEGEGNQAMAHESHCGGFGSVTSGRRSFAHGVQLNANYYGQFLIGQQNVDTNGDTSSTEANNFNYLYPAFEIGNGSNEVRNTGFKVTFGGEVYADGSFHSGGADYAEMFEWGDEATKEEDHTGYFVTLDGERIVKANDKSLVIGVVSANPSIVCDDVDHWQGKYKTDEWGRKEVETIENKDGFTFTSYKVSETFVPERKFIPRSQRKGWESVGLIGKVLVRHDGSLKKGGMCKCGPDGMATSTAGKTGYYVMNVINDHVAKILFK